MFKKLIFLCLLGPALVAGQTATIVKGNLYTVTGTPASGKLRFILRGCDDHFVRVPGVGLLNITPIEKTANEISAGFVMYRNSAIECDGSTTSNYYEVEMWMGDVKLFSKPFRFTEPLTDLNSIAPMTSEPAETSNYLRLTSQPFLQRGLRAGTEGKPTFSKPLAPCNTHIANLNTTQNPAPASLSAFVCPSLLLDRQQKRPVTVLQPSVSKTGRGKSAFSTDFGPASTIGQNVNAWRAAFDFELATQDAGYCDWTVQILMHSGSKLWPESGPCINFKGGLYVATEQLAPSTNRAEAANFILYYDTLAGKTSTNLELDVNNDSVGHAPALSSLYTALTIASGGAKSPGTGIWVGSATSLGAAPWRTGVNIPDFMNQGLAIASKAKPVDNTSAAAAILLVPYTDKPNDFFQIRGMNANQSNTVFSVDNAGAAAFTGLTLNGTATDFAIQINNSAKGAKAWQILNEATGGAGGSGNLCFYDASHRAVRGCVLGRGGIMSYGPLVATGATPATTAGQIGLGATTGVGNGTPGMPVTTTSRGDGSGPVNPDVVTKYLKVNIEGTDYWIPLSR